MLLINPLLIKVLLIRSVTIKDLIKVAYKSVANAIKTVLATTSVATKS